MKTYREVLDFGKKAGFGKAKGIENPRLDAWLLLEFVLQHLQSLVLCP